MIGVVNQQHLSFFNLNDLFNSMTNQIRNFVLTVLLSIQRKKNLSLFTKRKIFHFSCLIEYILNWLSMRSKIAGGIFTNPTFLFSIRSLLTKPPIYTKSHISSSKLSGYQTQSWVNRINSEFLTTLNKSICNSWYWMIYQFIYIRLHFSVLAIINCSLLIA